MLQSRRVASSAILITSLLIFVATPVAAETSSTTSYSQVTPVALADAVPVAVASKAQPTTGRKQHPRKSKRRSWRYRPPAIRLMRLESTAYCLGGRMANGRFTHDGAVAVPRSWPLGGWYQVRSGPLKGKILKAEDHIGHGSQFDIWMPCSSTAWYGRRSIAVAQIKPHHATLVLRAQRK